MVYVQRMLFPLSIVGTLYPVIRDTQQPRRHPLLAVIQCDAAARARCRRPRHGPQHAIDTAQCAPKTAPGLQPGGTPAIPKISISIESRPGFALGTLRMCERNAQ